MGCTHWTLTISKVLALATVTGCGTSNTAESDSTDSDAPTDTSSDTDEEPAPEPAAALHGRVTDPNGNPVGGAAVNFCKAICQTATTDASGNYALTGLIPNQASFYVVPLAESELLPLMNVLTLADGDDRTIDVKVYPASVETPIPTIAGLVEVENGLQIGIGLDVLKPAPFTELGSYFFATEIPSTDFPHLEVAEEPITMWVLAPFEAEAEAGMPVRVKNRFGLEAGAKANLWAAGAPNAATWLPVGELTVDGDGEWFSGETSLPIVTTLLLSRSAE